MPAPTHYIPDWSTGYRFGHALPGTRIAGLTLRPGWEPPSCIGYRPRSPLHPHWVDARYWQSVAAIAATTCPACDGAGCDVDPAHVLVVGGTEYRTICPACGGSGLALVSDGRGGTHGTLPEAAGRH